MSNDLKLFNENPVAWAAQHLQKLIAIIKQAKKAMSATGHKTSCGFSGCTCGKVENFKIESGEFWRLIQQIDTAAKPAAEGSAGQTISSGMARYLDIKGNTNACVQTGEGGEGLSCGHCGAVMIKRFNLGRTGYYWKCTSCGETTGAMQPTEGETK